MATGKKDLGNIISVVIVSLFLLVCLAYSMQAFYKVFVKSDPTETIQYSVILAVFFLSSLILIGCLKSGPDHRKNAAIVTLSLVAALYLSECGLYLFNIDPTDRREAHFRFLEGKGIKVDRRTPLEYTIELRLSGIDAVPPVSPSSFVKASGPESNEFLPLSGISSVLTIHCNENGNYAPYKSDEHGFNNPRGLWSAGKEIQVAVVGDSFASGACVPEGRDVASLIRKIYPKSLNVGIGGTGPLLQLAIMAEYLAPQRPANVFWLYYENDLDELNQLESKDPRLRAYLTPGHTRRLLERQSQSDAFVRAAVDRMLANAMQHRGAPNREGELRKTLRLVRTRKLLSLPFETPPRQDASTLALYRQTLQRARDLVHGWGGRLTFVFLPDWSRAHNPRGDDGYRRRAEVLAAVAETGLPVIDVYSKFAAYPDASNRFFEFPGSHYNETGYDIVAQAIVESLREPEPDH